MKKYLLLFALTFVSVLSMTAQSEIMVVKTTDGKTTEFVTGNIAEVAFITDVMYFEYPYTEWGTSVTDVKAEMDARNYYLLAERSDALMYAGKHREDYTVYYFDASKKLSTAGVVIKQSVASISTLDAFVQDKMGFYYLAEETDSEGYLVKMYFTSDLDIAMLKEADLDGDPIVLVQIVSSSSLGSQKRITKNKAIEEFNSNKNEIFSILKEETKKFSSVMTSIVK